MPETAHFHLCEVNLEHYDAMIELWKRSGLSVRPDGRDSVDAFARQEARGVQRIAGLWTDDGKLVAVTVLTHDGRKGWINRLAVDPAYRRRGLAARLVAEAERWFTEDIGLEIWAALIEAGNDESKALFGHLGYHTHDVVYISKRTRSAA